MFGLTDDELEEMALTGVCTVDIETLTDLRDIVIRSDVMKIMLMCRIADNTI